MSNNDNDCVPSAAFDLEVITNGIVGLKTENCFLRAGSIPETSVTQIVVEPAPLPISVPGPLLSQPPLQPSAQLAGQLASVHSPGSPTQSAAEQHSAQSAVPATFSSVSSVPATRSSVSSLP